MDSFAELYVHNYALFLNGDSAERDAMRPRCLRLLHSLYDVYGQDNIWVNTQDVTARRDNFAWARLSNAAQSRALRMRRRLP